MKKGLLLILISLFVFSVMADNGTAYEPPEGFDNALVFGMVKYNADLGLDETDIIVDADYNPATGNLVVAVSKTEFGAANPDGIILIVDADDLSVIKTITGVSDDGGHGYGLDRVRVTEDGVIIAMNTVGCVYLVGTEDDDTADGRHLHGPVYTNNAGTTVWGGTRNFDVIGNYNAGECIFVSGRGRRVRLSQNSPADVNDFEEIRDYDLIEFPTGYERGVILAQDGSMLYAYGGSGNSAIAFSGSIATGYSEDAAATAALAGYGWETLMSGNFDAGIIAVGGNKGDVYANPDFGYYYTRVAFRNIHTGEAIGTGNAVGSGWESLDEGEYWEADDGDNPFPGLYVYIPWSNSISNAGGYAFIPDKQRVYSATPGGIIQFHAPDDDPLYIEDWSLFSY